MPTAMLGHSKNFCSNITDESDVRPCSESNRDCYAKEVKYMSSLIKHDRLIDCLLVDGLIRWIDRPNS